MDNQKYIVRCDKSGVFYGEIAGRDGQEIEMRNARCLWRWEGAFTLIELATSGTSNPKGCRFTAYASSLTVLDAIEIIPCTEQAVNSIEGVLAWQP